MRMTEEERTAIPAKRKCGLYDGFGIALEDIPGNQVFTVFDTLKNPEDSFQLR